MSRTRFKGFQRPGSQRMMVYIGNIVSLSLSISIIYIYIYREKNENFTNKLILGLSGAGLECIRGSGNRNRVDRVGRQESSR